MYEDEEEDEEVLSRDRLLTRKRQTSKTHTHSIFIYISTDGRVLCSRG